MTSETQRAELKAKIWKLANDVRGSVDGLQIFCFLGQHQ
jgi:type I restriction enzyme M protein